MLLPSSTSGKKGESMKISYSYGHPYEHQTYPASAPAKTVLVMPDGSVKAMENWQEINIAGEGEEKVNAFQLELTPPARGDYTLIVTSPPIWIPEEKAYHVDQTRVTIHVETQKGWDNRGTNEKEFSLQPLTRPYGILSGTAFSVQCDLSGAHLETERYLPEAPKVLPPDELITFTAKSDRTGKAVVSLPDPGWWCICATKENAGTMASPTGEMAPVHHRAAIWVYVTKK
ncbi:MAG: DUF4198 domain-containing protein [Zavarzinella sp.]